MIFNEAGAQSRLSQFTEVQGSGLGQGPDWEGPQVVGRPPFSIKDNELAGEGMCRKGEKESASPIPHTSKRRYVA